MAELSSFPLFSFFFFLLLSSTVFSGLYDEICEEKGAPTCQLPSTPWPSSSFSHKVASVTGRFKVTTSPLLATSPDIFLSLMGFGRPFIVSISVSSEPASYLVFLSILIFFLLLRPILVTLPVSLGFFAFADCAITTQDIYCNLVVVSIAVVFPSRFSFFSAIFRGHLTFVRPLYGR